MSKWRSASLDLASDAASFLLLSKRLILSRSASATHSETLRGEGSSRMVFEVVWIKLLVEIFFLSETIPD